MKKFYIDNHYKGEFIVRDSSYYKNRIAEGKSIVGYGLETNIVSRLGNLFNKEDQLKVLEFIESLEKFNKNKAEKIKQKTIFKITETKYSFPADDRPIQDEYGVYNACPVEDNFIKEETKIIKDYAQDKHPIFGYDLVFTDYTDALNYIEKNFSIYLLNYTDINYDCYNNEFYYYEYNIVDISDF